MSHRDVTVREGTSEKYWYTLAGYTAIAILAILYNIYIFSRSGINVQAAGMMSALSIFGVSAIGLVTYPALFKDSAYLRGTRSGWKPKWWNYLAIGLGIPVLAAIVSSFLGIAIGGGVIGVMVHVITAPVMSGYYLYNRHQMIGVP